MKYPVGQRLRKLRRARDLTQQQLADLAQVNMLTISRIERAGTRDQMYADTLGDIAQALGVSADYLLGLTEKEMPCDALDPPHA